MNDLFGYVSRDERQAQCLHNWKAYKGHACVVAATGFGKTRVGINLITKFIQKKPSVKIVVVVPTSTLKDQWETQLDELGFGLNCEVVIINTAIKNMYNCELLVIDECHRFAADTFSAIFDVVNYKYILGLTATIERLDGKEEIIMKYCPVCDTITLEECMLNGWISQYKEYQVLLEVNNINEFKTLNKEFQEHFSFFDFDFDTAMNCVGKDGFKNRAALRDRMCIGRHVPEEERKEIFRAITYHATAMMRVMQARKAFINNHPKKLEVTRKIIEARSNSKIITFSNNIKMAEAIGIGKVYSGKDTKKKGRATLEELRKGDFKVLNTIQKANEGLDIPDLSVGIILGLDSSSIKAVQRVGRVVRAQPGKSAEIFNLVIDGTTETEWFRKGHNKSSYITINEEGLNDVLKGVEPKPYYKPINRFAFRY